MCGCVVREIPVDAQGDIDLGALQAVVGANTAGIMLTNPSTLGVFERRIEEVARIVHAAGGLLYYDGANLNAILGKVRPGDMGFDVIHMNLHKTFSTPHGGGGPGAGAVGVSVRLQPFLPLPVVARLVAKEEGGSTSTRYRWLTERDLPQSIGRLSGFMGNAGVLLRAYIYMRMLGREGMSQVGEYATLNANYLLARLRQAGFDAAYPARRASHEFIITLKRQAKELEVTAMDFAKRLLDHGFHAPTTYFPLLVPECLLIEPTETETKDTLDAFVAAMVQIQKEAEEEPERVTSAPHTMPVRRLDDVRAAKQLDLRWKPKA
jgi:glycine dehydrogenase subunit 2